MPSAATTTYLNIESIGADKLIASMSGLQKSMNFVGGMLRDLNRGLGILPAKAKASDAALKSQAASATEAMQAANQLRVAMVAQNAATTSLAESVAKLTKAQAETGQKKGLDWTALYSKIQLVKQGYDLVKNSLTSLGQEALRLSQAWDVQRQSEEKLAAAMRAGGMGDQIDGMKEWASALQSATTYGDEQVLTLASQAAKFSQNEKITKRATEAAMDFAAATGGDAASALSSIGRAMQGNASSLQQLGIYLTDTEAKRLKEASAAERQAFVLKKLEEHYQGAAKAMAATPTGALKQAQNILSDIDEEVGKLVSPALYAGLEVVKDYLTSQRAGVQKITGDAESLNKTQDKVLVGLATAGGVLIDLKTGVIILKNSVEILAEAVLMTVGYPLKMLSPLFDGLARLPGLGENVSRSLSMVAGGLKATYEQSAMGLMHDVDDIQNAIKEAQKQKDQLWKDLEKNRDTLRGVSYEQGGGPGAGAGDLSKTKKEREEEEISFSFTLSKEEQALLDFETKRLQIQADFAAKRKALESLEVTDIEYKNTQKSELERQEQEALRQIRLTYAQETNDQLTLMQDQYRQYELAQTEAMEAAKRQKHEETLKTLGDNLKSVGSLGLDMFTSWIEGTGDWRAQLFDALKSFSKNLMATSLASIIDQALVNQAKAQGSQAGIPVIGPALALVAGLAMFATTMALKSKLKPAEVKYAQGGYISAGMVKGGAWGRDSVPALLQPGERVLSKKETEAYDAAGTRQPLVQNININISGQLSTPAQITDTVRRVLVPELKAAVRAGYAI